MQLAPAAHGGTHGTIELHHADGDDLGDVDASVAIVPAGRDATVQLRVQTERGPAVRGDVLLRIPDALGDTRAWFDGVHHGEVAVDHVRPDVIQRFLPASTTLSGELNAHVGLGRSTPHAPLDVTAEVNARGRGHARSPTTHGGASAGGEREGRGITQFA